MAKLSLIQTNFTAGELSPRLMARVDVARYQNGCKKLENGLIVVQGGVMRTWGTSFVQEVKYSDKKTRLIPYIFNRDQSYIVEFGDKYIRVFKDTEQQTELESPYTEDMLFNINYVQGADTMFLAHQDLPIHRLRRVTDTEWTLAEAPFIVKPFDEIGEKPDIKLTLSKAEKPPADNPTETVVATLESDFFLDADLGRIISSGSGIAEITAVTNAKTATLKITSSFKTTELAAKTWKLEGSPIAKCTPSAKDPVGTEITLTLDKAGWRAGDVGKYVRINKGLCLIKTFTNTTSVKAEIKTVLSAVVAASALSWTLEATVWSDEQGYPAAVTLHNQRLICGGTKEKPQTVWISKIAEYLNFEISTNDEDAAAFTMSSDQINPIVHISQVDVPLVLTYGGEFALTGSASKSAISPTNINIKNQSTYGCNNVKPMRAGDDLLFIQRSGKKLRAMSYRAEIESFSAEDVTILSEHITESGIVDMAFQQEPYSILWLVRGDGQMATLTLDRVQDVTGWSRQVTDGNFETVATIPQGDYDQVWTIIKREINGQVKRYIEYFNADSNAHSSKQYSNDDPQDTYTGLEHLEGKEVDIVADGAVMQRRQVVNGTIHIERKAYSVVIGLPYSTLIELLDFEVQGATGTVQGNKKRVGEIVLRFFETTGCLVNNEPVPSRKFGENVLDQPAPLFTGDESINLSGWNNQITIEQSQPLPFHLLGVISKVTVND